MKTTISCLLLILFWAFKISGMSLSDHVNTPPVLNCKYRIPAGSYWASPQLRTCSTSVNPEKNTSVEVHVGEKKEGKNQNKIAFQRSLLKLADFSHFVPNASWFLFFPYVLKLFLRLLPPPEKDEGVNLIFGLFCTNRWWQWEPITVRLPASFSVQTCFVALWLHLCFPCSKCFCSLDDLN